MTKFKYRLPALALLASVSCSTIAMGPNTLPIYLVAHLITKDPVIETTRTLFITTERSKCYAGRAEYNRSLKQSDYSLIEIRCCYGNPTINNLCQ